MVKNYQFFSVLLYFNKTLLLKSSQVIKPGPEPKPSLEIMNPTSFCLQCGRSMFDPWVRKIPWRRKW